MLAIVKETAEPGGLRLRKRPRPTPKAGEVLVKILKTAICGTDLHIYNWDAWAQRTIRTPQIIGHEFVGRIEELGAGVTNVKRGDLVSGEGHLVCGRCRHCITGYPHLCRRTRGIGVDMDGVFAEYIRFPAGNIWLCDRTIAQEIHAIMDPLGNAVHSSLSFNILGEDVLITGAGPIGLMAVPIIRRAGARNIVVTDVNDNRLEMARTLGATATVNVGKHKISSVFGKLGIKEGFDVGLEMSGSPAALRDQISAMHSGGKIALLGIFPAPVEIDMEAVVFKSLTLRGIYGRQMFDTWYRTTALLQSGLADDLAPIITHRFHFSEFERGFDAMKTGDCGKVILEWT